MMTDVILNRQQQRGLHIIMTAVSLGLLPNDGPALTWDASLAKSSGFFYANRHIEDVILNEEPIYIAGRILRFRDDQLETYFEPKWPQYHLLMEEITANMKQPDGMRLLSALGSISMIENTTEIHMDYQIEEFKVETLIVNDPA